MSADQKDDESLPVEFGPAMQALPTDKQRRFVMALYDEEAPAKGDGLLIYAARAAGYGTATSTDKALSVMANRVVHDPRTRAAIAEYSHAVVRTLPPEAVKALKEVIRNPKHRDHMRAINAVIDRVDPVEHVVKVQDDRPPSLAATQEVLARIAELARRAGLPAPRPPIDAEYSVVEPGR